MDVLYKILVLSANGITHATSDACNKSYVAIGDRSLISSRNEYLLFWYMNLILK